MYFIEKKTSVVASHCETGHCFYFENIGILDEEPNYNKRRLSEMLHIHLQPSPLNKKEDTENLHVSYSCSLNYLKTTT